MKRIYYILLIVTFLAGCHRKEDPVRVPAEEHGIALSAGIEWPDDTKAVINNLTGLANDGFVVWGTWVQAGADNSQYSGDYASGTNNKVFGLAGTKAYYSDWDYSPMRFWTRGSYKFAAALPASAFNADHVMKNDQNGTAGLSGRIGSDGKLTLTGGVSGFNLRDNQIDLMVAFDNVDNSSDANTSSDKVNLMFNHQLAQVAFKANFDPDAVSEITINKITMYGNTYSAAGAEFTYNDKGTSDKEDDIITASWTPGEKSSSTNVYKQVSGSWNTSGTTVISELLVFPEAHTFTVVVDYTESYAGVSTSGTQSATVSGTWTAGNKYLYEFKISPKNIIFGEPKVSKWGTGGSADVIPM